MGWEKGRRVVLAIREILCKWGGGVLLGRLLEFLLRFKLFVLDWLSWSVLKSSAVLWRYLLSKLLKRLWMYSISIAESCKLSSLGKSWRYNRISFFSAVTFALQYLSYWAQFSNMTTKSCAMKFEPTLSCGPLIIQLWSSLCWNSVDLGGNLPFKA